jgi:hypothetical protein
MEKIREWPSITNVADVYEGSGTDIIRAIRRSTLLYGSYWKYTKIIDLDGELWRSIPDVQNYMASSHGRIKKIMEFYERLIHGTFSYPYIVVTIESRQYRKHILICRTFHGPKPIGPGRYVVNHLNGIKNDNRSSNLGWVTTRENNIHAISTGLVSSVIAVNRWSLDRKTVHRYESIAYAARELNLGEDYISFACKGIMDSYGGFIWEFADPNHRKNNDEQPNINWGINRLKMKCKQLGTKGHCRKGVTKEELMDLINEKMGSK